LQYWLDPNFGTGSLVAGFIPDPFALPVVSGGGVDARYLNEPSCLGYATAAPDFELTWDGSGNLLRFYFVADIPGEDTVMLINDPSGNWYCGDDYDYPDVRDPMVDFPSAADGTYDIWVASYIQGDTVMGTLYITEMMGNHP